MNASHLRRGMVIVFNGEPHKVLDFHHRTPGNLRAFVQVKLRNLATGTSFEHRFSSTENVDRAILEQHEMEYLYADGDLHYFMNTETFEQVPLTREMLGDALDYLLPGVRIQVDYFNGEPISVELPSAVELRVVQTEPELRGATASASYKPAVLETGVTVQVPPFIKEGDVIRVNPNEGTYMERA
ncbi:MAG TPA: elongation factor P [Acidobacteriota bacterium]|nr:elongation factor P [Acidobacteriota bacterium]HRV09229.1 elongation factor P [Acidobacteriota bacterium]